MVELIKKTINNMNGLKSMPQKTTFGGVGAILYQLSNLLSEIPVGGFIISLQGMTYGALISGYSPIIFGLILIFFNEDKFINLIKGEE